MSESWKHCLPASLPTPIDADHERLVIHPGPWMEARWVVVPEVGNPRRRKGICAVAVCHSSRHSTPAPGIDLCYPHYTQWWRANSASPLSVVEWLPSAKQPQARVRSNSVFGRAIDFESLPPLIATEIRFVVGQKITAGDWTPNRALLSFLDALIATTRDSQSLLERRPEDWNLLLQQRLGTSDRRDAASYAKTFFSTLHRALVLDPWVEDRWLWKDCFDGLVHHSSRTNNGLNANWANITQEWLRNPVKEYARVCLTTGSRAWATILTWVRALTRLSSFLEQEGVDDPADLDRALFIDYVAWLNQSGASKHALSGANVAASVLSAVQDVAREAASDGHVAGQVFGSEIFLRHGENVVEKVRDPKPFPQDVVERVDKTVLNDPLLDESARLMLQVTRWAGFRISELVTLRLDCLRHNGSNGYWIHHYMTKTKSWRRIPIPNDLAQVLLAQQERVRVEYGPTAEFMFPSPARSSQQAQRVRPWSPGGFRKAVSASFVRNGITRSSITGEDISGGAIHRYRHTIGTALLNAGWTQREVSEFLGHMSETMTNAYAKILDETLVRKINDFHEATTTARTLQPADGVQIAVDPAVERMRARFTYELPDGGCTLPVNQKCDIRDNPCSDCAFFDPSRDEVREVHQNRRKRLKLHIENSSSAEERSMNQKALDYVERVLERELLP